MCLNYARHVTKSKSSQYRKLLSKRKNCPATDVLLSKSMDHICKTGKFSKAVEFRSINTLNIANTKFNQTGNATTPSNNNRDGLLLYKIHEHQNKMYTIRKPTNSFLTPIDCKSKWSKSDTNLPLQ